MPFNWYIDWYINWHIDWYQIAPYSVEDGAHVHQILVKPYVVATAHVAHQIIKLRPPNKWVQCGWPDYCMQAACGTASRWRHRAAFAGSQQLAATAPNGMSLARRSWAGQLAAALAGSALHWLARGSAVAAVVMQGAPAARFGVTPGRDPGSSWDTGHYLGTA
jgi:hypothetical protein